MLQRHFTPDDDGRLTLRVPVGWLAFAVALALHLVMAEVASRLPDPPKAAARIQLTLAPPPPPPAQPSSSRKPAPRSLPAPKRQPPERSKRPASPAPVKSPVAPELLPSEDPPENRAQLPVIERSPDPAPPPNEPTWEEQLLAQLAATTPKRPRLPTGNLRPSNAGLDRVAAADPRLHDERTERRLQEDFGVFFRRGLDALRGHWHPDEVLNQRDAARRCGRHTRTTYAVAVLDKEGHVVEVELKFPSGCPDLDEEAIAAFKRVAHFPHPPAGIFVGPDGSPMETARYPVRFIVTFDGSLQLDWR